MATITKTLTTTSKVATVSNGILRGSVGFVDEKGNSVGQATITIKDGKVVETGTDASDVIKSAIVTIGSEFSALIDSLVEAGALDPMNRGPRSR